MRRQISRKAGNGSAPDGAPSEEGISAAHQAVAVKRVLASQIEQAMNEKQITKAEMARRMETSRSQLDRLLDPDVDSVTLDTLARAAYAVGRQVRVEFVEAR